MEIQQHDGVVVKATVISAGLRQAPTRERGVMWGEGGARDLVRLPSLPPLYIGPLGGRRPWDMQSPRGAAAKGGLAPQVKWGAPHP